MTNEPQNLDDILKEKIFNNPDMYKFIKKHNKKQKLDFYRQLLGGVGACFSREEYVLMLLLGIPIGVNECIDANGAIIDDGLTLEGKEPVEPVIHIYKPINSLEEYSKYQNEVLYYPDLIVNPMYMTKKQVRNLAYCLSLANQECCLDIEKRSELQLEIVNSVPLKYDKAMKIFNKYFDKSIQKKYIYDYGVGYERFYYLSGLKKLIKNKEKYNER